MPLTQQQQKNAERLIDDHFKDLRDAVQNQLRSNDLATIEVTPELKALAAARAEELTAERETAERNQAKYTDDLKALGYDDERTSAYVNYYGGKAVDEVLIERVVNNARNATYRARQAELNDAYQAITTAWSEARRRVLIATLIDADEAKNLVDSLPSIDTFLQEPTA